jgi:hypothetical protein
MDREEWMYKLPRVGNDMSFLGLVRNFVAAAKKHRLRLGRERTICACNSCKNKLLQEDNVVQSHLIRHGFVKDYTVWKYHGEADSSATGASSQGNSSTTSTVNDVGQQPSSSTPAAGGDNGDHDYISINDLLQDIADNDGGGDGEQGDVLGPEDAELFENLANHTDQDDIMFGNPKWLENFKEMKQAAIDPLYKDCPKHWTVLRFNLQLLMLKARHGWSDTSFNDLLRMLADTYPEGNKVSANTYRAKKMIQPVAMKLKKFHACPNHCILYRGKYENLQSCPHCDASRYKRNAGCHVDVDNKGPMRGQQKKQKTSKKKITSPEDEEEEGYM